VDAGFRKRSCFTNSRDSIRTVRGYVVDIFSYFRRRRGMMPRQPFAADEAIDLGSIGGTINSTYVDIASLPAADEKVRARPPAPRRPPPRRPPPPPDEPAERAPPQRPAREEIVERPPRRLPDEIAERAPPRRLPPDETAERAPPRRPPPDETAERAPPRRPPPDDTAERAPPRRPPPEEPVERPPAAARPRRRVDGKGSAPPDRKGVLAVHGVEKSFVGRKVVKGVSLYVRRGEAVGLLGPNGAGKTTVFYMVTGLIRADKGRIDLDGHNVTALPMYQRARLGIGYLPQEASIFRGLNVEQNIRAVLEVVERDPKRRERDLNGLLEEFNITRLRKTPAIALSGGERRRVEIARSLATRPNYMLLDEPFAGIDPIAVGDIQALVRHLTNRGIGVLITDHNVRETLGLTDRAYIIYSGEVLMEGRGADIVNDPEVRRLYLGEQFQF
jgi:lipopolysaccharide export system ATP-binding protein